MRYDHTNEEKETVDVVTSLRNLIDYAIETGDSQTILGAYGMLGEVPDRRKLQSALKHAISREGFTIDDLRTDVGRLYQELWGRDFEGPYNYNGIRLSFGNLPEAEKNIVRRTLCSNRLFQMN